LYSAQFFAEMLGVSRTLVREALLKLTSEASLVCLDVRGFKIREFTDKKGRDVFETRPVIETYVFKHLVNGQLAEDIRDMERSLKVNHSFGRILTAPLIMRSHDEGEARAGPGTYSNSLPVGRIDSKT
jgi:hypothetical protein